MTCGEIPFSSEGALIESSIESSWPEVVVTTRSDRAEQLETWLFCAGALSVTSVDEAERRAARHEAVEIIPILEPAPGEIRLWEDVTLIGLFAQGSTPDDLHSALHLAAADEGIDTPVYALQQLQDTQWERTWMAHFQPMQFGARLWVCPSHQDPVDGALNLRLDPGLAFGTGTHATTALCLRWLGAGTAQSLQPLAGQRVLDYGCGSGVLAIAALLLGAESAVAVDIDDQALLATRDNAELNGVGDRIQILTPDQLHERELERVDVLLANILYQPLSTLAETFAGLLQADGKLALSGILETQVDALSLRYNAGFLLDPPTIDDGWALLTATRRSDC